MRGQLGRMIELGRLERISLHVLPYSAGAHLWVAVPFDIFALRPPGRLTVAVADQVTQSLFVEDEREVAAHEEIFNHLLAASLDESRSLEVIERILSRS